MVFFLPLPAACNICQQKLKGQGYGSTEKNIHQKPPNNRTCNKNSGEDDKEEIDEDDAVIQGLLSLGGHFEMHWSA